MWGLIILVLCAYPSAVYSTGSSSSNTRVGLVQPLPFSSVVLFERYDKPLCLGVSITPFKILVGSSCFDLLKPRHRRDTDAIREYKKVIAWLGITYGRSHSHQLDSFVIDGREIPYPLSIVIINRNPERSKSKYVSIVFIPEEINNNFLIPLLGAGIYNKESGRVEQFGLVPTHSHGSLIYARSQIGLIPDTMVWEGGLVFYLNSYVGVLTHFHGEDNGNFIYVIKTGFYCEDFLSYFTPHQVFNKFIHDPLVPMNQLA